MRFFRVTGIFYLKKIRWFFRLLIVFVIIWSLLFFFVLLKSFGKWIKCFFVSKSILIGVFDFSLLRGVGVLIVLFL